MLQEQALNVLDNLLQIIKSWKEKHNIQKDITCFIDIINRIKQNTKSLKQEEYNTITPIIFNNISQCIQETDTLYTTSNFLDNVFDVLCGVWILSYGFSIWCCTFDEDARIALGVLQKMYLHIHIACIQVNYSKAPMVEYAYEFSGLNTCSEETRKWLGEKLYNLVYCCKTHIESESSSRIVAEILSKLPDETRCTNTLKQHITETGQAYAIFKLVRRGKHKGPTDTFAIGEAIRNIAKDRLSMILKFKKDQNIQASKFMPINWALERFTHGFGIQNEEGICNLIKSLPDFTHEEVEQEITSIAHTILSHTDWKKYKLYITTGQKEYEFKCNESTNTKTDIDLDTMNLEKLVNEYTGETKCPQTPKKLQRVGWIINWAESRIKHPWEDIKDTHKLKQTYFKK